MFDAPCGSLVAIIYLTIVNMDTINASVVDSALQTIGIGDINVLYGKLFIYFSSSNHVTWPFMIFSSLQVVRPNSEGSAGILLDTSTSVNVTLSPGSGFSQLMATSTFETASSPVIQNPNLQLVSNLQCAGYVGAFPNVVSLAGLEKLTDGVAEGYSSYIVVDSVVSSQLVDISALSAYGKCGTAAALPSDYPSRPQIKVAACPQLFTTWPAVCRYIANGTCS